MYGLTTLLTAHAVQHRMVGCIMDWKGRGLLVGNIQVFDWRE
jgi:hypothetical protein